MHILVITTFYPNVQEPNRAVFIKSLVKALSHYDDISVIAPVPYSIPIGLLAGAKTLARISNREVMDGVEIYHPRLPYIPKVEIFTGVSYYLSIKKIVKELQNKHGKTKLIIHGHRIYPDGMGIALVAKKLNIPFVLTAHGSDINRTAKRLGMRNQVKWALENADAIISVSEQLRECINTIVDKPIVHIPCAGYSTSEFSLLNKVMVRNIVGLNPEGRVVIFIGQLVRTKGVEVLIQAWHILKQRKKIEPKDRLILVGEGDNRIKLMEMTKKYSICDSVQLMGSVRHDNISTWLNAADVLCLPSYMEGTPNVVIEALASGIPVVATAVGGIPEVVTNRSNGILVPPGHAELLAEGICKVLEEKWDRNNLVKSVKDYTWKKLAKRNHDLLISISEKSV